MRGNKWKQSDNSDYELFLNDSGEIEAAREVRELEDLIGEHSDGNFEFKFYTPSGNYYGYDKMKAAIKKQFHLNIIAMMATMAIILG